MPRLLRALMVDCDNTLYPPEVGFLEAGDRRITDFLARRLDLPHDEADALRLRLWRDHGTTARGLAVEYGIAPEEMCREALESLDFRAYLRPDPVLARALAAIPVPLYVFTNSTASYTAQVLDALGLSEVFAGAFAIESLGWQGKPHAAAFERVAAALELTAEALALADDAPWNVAAAREMGWLGVGVGPEAAECGDLAVERLADLGPALSRAGVL